MTAVDPSRLNWTAARAAAQQLARICADAQWLKRDDVAAHADRLALVDEQMNAIVVALHLVPPAVTP